MRFACPQDPLSAVRSAPTFGERGFTLTEMAVVLAIVALLLGGMLMPLSALQDIRNVAATQKLLADAGEALYGYAASRAGAPFLPCPDTDGDGAENRTGPGCTAPTGALPWRDLGLGRQDAWNQPLGYAVDGNFSVTGGFGLTTQPGSNPPRICAAAACATVIATTTPAVLYSRGKNGASEQAHRNYFDRTPTPGYDDVVAWLPTTVLFNRMISAGKLP